MHLHLLFLVPIQLLIALAPDPVPAEERLLQAAARVRLGYADEALALLDRLEIPAKDDGLSEAAGLVRARALILAGTPDEALPLLTPLATGKRQGLQVLARYHQAQALAALGRHENALEVLERVRKDPLAEALAPDLEIAGLESSRALADKKAVARWLSRVERAPRLEKSRQLTLRIGARDALGKKVATDCETLYRSFPCAALPASCDAEALRTGLSKRQRFQRAEKLMSCWGYVEAAAEFEAFLADPAYRRHHDRSHFYLGEIHSRKLRDDRAKAFAHYRHVVEHGGGDRAYALYQMGRCKMNLEEYDEAVRIFEEYIDKYPRGDFVERCYYYFGWLPYDHDELEAALPGFDRYLDRYKKARLRSYILWFKGWTLFRLGRLPEAMKTLERLTGYGNDIVAGKAWYWLGRGHQQRGEAGKAAAAWHKCFDRWPLSYYGLLSWRELKKLGESLEHPLLTTELPAWEPPLPSHASRYLPARERERLADVLDAVRVGEVAVARRWFAPHEHRFERAVRKDPAPARLWLYTLLEEPHSLRSWGRKHHRARGDHPTAKSRLGWMLEYPPAYRLLVEAEAAHTSLPPWFFYSIMRQESRYRRGVISWADAVGLVQVIPSTGSRTAARLGIEFARDRLADPAFNLKLGIHYLGFLAQDMRDQLILVAASYNAGPAPIRTFLEKNRGRDLPFVIEEIAYNEARNYCRKVSGHVLKYVTTYTPIPRRKAILERLLPETVNFDIGHTVLY